MALNGLNANVVYSAPKLGNNEKSCHTSVGTTFNPLEPGLTDVIHYPCRRNPENDAGHSRQFRFVLAVLAVTTLLLANILENQLHLLAIFLFINSKFNVIIVNMYILYIHTIYYGLSNRHVNRIWFTS